MPDSLGPFRVEAEIGRGGMGIVWRARDERLDRLVAIKAIAPELAADPDRMARFRQEARTIAQLNHPHIAQIHQFLEHDGQTYLVLEYVPGQSLAERIDSGGSLPIEQSLRLCAQVARAMEAAHARGIVHRDLKPDNIRITDDGTAKVLDFGIALAGLPRKPDPRAATMVDDAPAPKAEGRMVGTPGYIAPEQILGEAVDARADIFSFGCILFECLTGRRAFQAYSVAGLVAATLREDPDLALVPPVARGGGDVVRTLIGRCLEKEAARRPVSISDARQALEEMLGAPQTVVEPAPSVAAIAPTNLHAAPDHFIGRTRELAELSALLDNVRLLTLTGSGGCGKTRLAMELGRRVPGRFAAGVWLVELAPTSDPALVPQAVATALGVKEQPGRALPAVLAEWFSRKPASGGEGAGGAAPVLLILDNCEHILDAVSGLITTLLRDAPGLRIVATSREALGVPGETNWRVPSLDLPPKRRDGSATPTPSPAGRRSTPRRTPSVGGASDVASLLACDSVALFVDRAREVRPGFELTEANAPSVANICRALDGIPLAIELAAARVKVLPPEQIERHLNDRFKLLRAGRGKAERHQTLRAAIDWSYRSLGDDEKRTLRHLSVFAGGCTLKAAAFVIGGAEGGEADEFEVLDLLTHLVDKSLLIADDHAGEARYRLLETVRQYSVEELDRAAETAAARDRHLAYFHALAEEARAPLDGPEQAEWLKRLDADLDNLLEAISWGAAAGVAEIAGDSRSPTPAERALRIGEKLYRFWEIRGHYSAARRAIARVLESAPDADASARAGALNTAAWCAFRQGDLDEAHRQQTMAVELWRRTGIRAGEAASLNGLGGIAWRQWRLDEARTCFEQALAIYRELADSRGEARMLGNLGTIVWGQDRRDEALELYRQALAIHRRLGDQRGIAMDTGNLAGAARQLGDFEDARRLRAESIEIFARLAHPQALAEQLAQAALLGALTDDPVVAARLAGASDAICDRLGAAHNVDTRRDLDEILPRAAASLRQRTGSSESWERELAEGRAMSLDDSVADALQWLRRGP